MVQWLFWFVLVQRLFWFVMVRYSEAEILWLKLDWICDHLYQKTSVFG